MPGTLPPGLVFPLTRPRTITVGGPAADVTDFTATAIQTAVDALGPRGGVVMLLAGVYDIATPIRLPNHVDLVGSGRQTILRKTEGVIALTSVDADYGELLVTVPDSTGFAPGMGVQVTERGAVDWQCSTSVITTVQPRCIHLRDRLIKDYAVSRGSTISNACSIIEIIDAQHASVRNLTIDGQAASNEFLNGCRGGAIYIHRSSNCVVSGVHISDFNGDGISWQITDEVVVGDCEVSGCTNFGLHPGTGCWRTFVAGCDVHHNGTDGLFVCWRVQQGSFERNHIHHNGRHGISIGHKDTDNEFADNTIHHNGGCGFYFRPETRANGSHRNHLTRNTISANRQGAIAIDSSATRVLVD